MPQAIPISIEIISDDEEQQQQEEGNVRVEESAPGFHTPLPSHVKRPRTDSEANNLSVILLDDDPTPQKPPFVESSPSYSFVPETPMLGASMHGVSILKCSTVISDPKIGSSSANKKLSGMSKLISLESDSESESGSGRENLNGKGMIDFGSDEMKHPWLDATSYEPIYSLGNVNSTQTSENSSLNLSSQPETGKVNGKLGSDNMRLDQVYSVSMPTVEVAEEKNKTDVVPKIVVKEKGNKRLTKEEKARIIEEKKQLKEHKKLCREALKAEAAEMKKLQREKQKWETGKFAIKSIVAEIDSKVVEGSIGGHLLSRFSEKGFTFRITSNPIERSIVWTMIIPEEISQFPSEGTVIPYILLVFEAEEFCNYLHNESLMDHVSRVQTRYPSYTVCYLANRLLAFINKREQAQYKNPESNGWKRPPVEEVMANLATHFHGVHSRLCVDEAELAEHIVGLTSSLATCQFRKKLTRLSVNANGSFVTKDCVDRNLIKKSVWLKALVAIPKVQPRFAITISKKYPSMKSLLSIYMDPNKSVHEKEFLLKDLTMEGMFGEEKRLGEMCSKRIYRVLMAQSGDIKTDDVESGADFFT